MNNFVLEMIGTMILILLGDGVVAGVVLRKTKSENSGWIVITFAWGLAVMTGAFVAAESGAHLNPALTIALALNSDLPWADVPVYIAGQLVGAFIGAILVWLHYMKHFEATDDQAAKLGVFATGPAIRHTPSNLISEIIGTFVLVFGILALGLTTFGDGLKPLIVGLLVVVIGLSLGGTTGYAINPARDLGPRIAHAILPIPNKGSSDWGYSWIPVVGPIIGGALAVFIYQLIY
ncbi:MIP/aquaporin family protein [Exiguobacterium acetylicum]|uniref:MIP/aquaporin family protein n=6 Tax=Bacillales Family XII. Incertae Sedis TaxID=539742 RepID=UPI00044F66CD|nr:MULTISPECIES: MIP/aquaporin family protein [Exiguobacterium]EZP61681.1 Glycerol transporter [Exiguobacterium sp. RIT341]MDQ6466275.1 MIP/aquaporin family protein [Exiguobacterium acetylicum]MDT0171775.1 MIP/aquaporin family protein [Exiguobacterium sp. BRG2]HAZ40037.1 aquaporin family protein [Exiguobacterium sp.]HBF57885.1 aquaporin family protein [Exiguobacterium sp.]